MSREPEPLLDQIAEYARHPVALSSRLVEDLNIDGDDAWHLVERAHRELGIDYSDFPYKQHFHSEGELIELRAGFRTILRLLHLSQAPPLRPTVPLTVHEFLKASGAAQRPNGA
jgi:hypothetical protein